MPAQIECLLALSNDKLALRHSPSPLPMLIHALFSGPEDPSADPEGPRQLEVRKGDARGITNRVRAVPEPGLTWGQGRCGARVGWVDVQGGARGGLELEQTRGQGRGGANSNTYQADA